MKKIALIGASSRVGRFVASHLLDSGAGVVLLVRDGQRVADLVDRGAIAAAGSLEDAAFVTTFTRGADALFVVTPTDPAAEKLRDFQNRVGAAAAAAVRSNRTPRVVNLSAAGAHRSSGNGPVNGLHDVERLLDAAASNLTHLRPAYFYENFLAHLDTIRDAGGILLPVSGKASIPMVAARDVARAAADRLLDARWTGRSVRGIHGPSEVSFQEVAATFSSVLGHPVIHIKVAEALARETLLRSGYSRDASESILELYRSIDTGTFEASEPRTSITTAATPLRAFVENALSPFAPVETTAIAPEVA